jgi:hypothetical protein
VINTLNNELEGLMHFTTAVHFHQLAYSGLHRKFICVTLAVTTLGAVESYWIKIRKMHLHDNRSNLPRQRDFKIFVLKNLN